MRIFATLTVEEMEALIADKRALVDRAEAMSRQHVEALTPQPVSPEETGELATTADEIAPKRDGLDPDS